MTETTESADRTAAASAGPASAAPGTVTPAAPEEAAPERTAPEADPLGAWADRSVLERAAADQAKGRRGALLRWGAAVLVLALTGTGAALAVTAPDRTDLPGLATPNDGRYAFPKLELPPLPSGRPSPAESAANGRHYADLRALVLPLPNGAVPEQPSATPSAPASPSASGRTASAAAASGPAGQGAQWAACTDFAGSRAADAAVAAEMSEFGCRTAVRRVWTAADGTRTEIWLFRTGSPAETSGLYTQLTSGASKDLPGMEPDDFTLDQDLMKAQGTSRLQQSKEQAGGTPTVRLAQLVSGDVAGVVLMTNPKGVAPQAFRQVTLLQVQLLQ
ncbi:hypothetical protein [Kitasatospora sp. NPDC059571]|uniref:hypothetical protein n=1 Tax=Kitasatospora sp. NPDC059571 TaxID=3346871 RepID=UPI0036749B0D